MSVLFSHKIFKLSYYDACVRPPFVSCLFPGIRILASVLVHPVKSLSCTGLYANVIVDVDRLALI